MRSDDEAVVYRPEDHPGFWRRILVDAIDLIALLVLIVALGVLTALLLPGLESLQAWVFFFLWVSACLGYAVLLKRTAFGTLGYAICRVRLVNLRGERPSLGVLFLRYAWALFGPWLFFIDLLWLTGDTQRQALRDKLSYTYMIRKGAQPACRGRVVYRLYGLWTWSFIFREVEPLPAPPDASAI